MVIKYGLIAEDMSDIEVIKILAKKIIGKNISSAFFVGKGCGAIRKKALGWCKALESKGCTSILLVHDKDKHNVSNLMLTLNQALASAPQKKKTVVIPSEELEAWLLSDQGALKVALHLQKNIKEEHHPESISSPKEYLAAATRKVSNNKIIYVNAIHNKLIAEHIDINKIAQKCPSFVAFHDFFF